MNQAERLTRRGEDGKGYFRRLNPDCNCNRECQYLWDHMIMLSSRLCDYEDTGFTPVDFSKVIKQLIDYKDLGATPEHLKELVKAEKQGRTVTLECNIHDTVYLVESVYAQKKFKGEIVVSGQIDRVIVGGTTGKPVYDICTEAGHWYSGMEPGEFFLSREAAMQTIKKGESKS